jgi:glutamate racemase
MIGIFDSGVGGLSVFREIRRILPEEKYIYWSDNAHCPYGEKSREYIIERAISITRHLLENGADIIVVACNTATAAAISTLRKEFQVKFIGMEPAVKPAVKITETGVITHVANFLLYELLRFASIASRAVS